MSIASTATMIVILALLMGTVSISAWRKTLTTPSMTVLVPALTIMVSALSLFIRERETNYYLLLASLILLLLTMVVLMSVGIWLFFGEAFRERRSMGQLAKRGPDQVDDK